MRLLFVCAAFLVGSAPAFCTVLRAGTAKADITPAGGDLMWGYEDRLKPGTGTLDPLYARVLVLEVGKKRLALVTLDLGRSFGAPSLAQLRESARRSGISCLLAAASHTHSAPVIQDDYKDGPPAWERAALEKIARAIQQAVSGLTEARIGTATVWRISATTGCA